MSAPARGLRLAPSADLGSAAGVVRALAVALLPELRDLIASERAGDELVDIAAFVPGSKRVVMRAAREGRIANASRVGRRWIAPRASIEAWLRGQGPRVTKTTDGDGDDLESLRISLARGGRR